jgi:hypothetical protein
VLSKIKFQSKPLCSSASKKAEMKPLAVEFFGGSSCSPDSKGNPSAPCPTASSGNPFSPRESQKTRTPLEKGRAKKLRSLLQSG